MLSPFSVPALDGQRGPVTLTDPCFVSDIHLSADKPDTLEGFLAFLKGPASAFPELVLLGDIFDYWLGDDASFTMPEVVKAFQDYSRTHKLYLMHGNRDFMMGKRFADEIGAVLLTDPCVATAGTTVLLLSHGDLWCTKDADYQKVRRRVRSVWWQWLAMRLPLSKRLSIARNARNRSKTAQRTVRDRTVTDVTPDAAEAAARAAGAQYILHGHTHRPARHDAEGMVPRLVLPDWEYRGETPIRGGYISLHDGIPVLTLFTGNPEPHATAQTSSKANCLGTFGFT